MAQEFQVVVVPSPEEASRFIVPWSDLAQHACEPNVFYAPWMFLPAWRHLSQGLISAVFVFDHQGQGNTERLVGFFPLVVRSTQHGLPLAHVMLWRYTHCFLCTPLLRAGVEELTIEAFLNWLEDWPGRGKLCRLPHIGFEGPVAQALNAVLRSRGTVFQRRILESRACLRSNLDFASYLALNISGKKKKEYRRIRNRLSELGRLETVVSSGQGEDQKSLDAWLDDFLALEDSGWKGRVGSALIKDPRNVSFFRETACASAAAGDLLLLKLTLNGLPVAMKCLFRSGSAGFAFKIAFAEKYARCSPGVLLELDTMEYLLNKRPVDWADSCADMGHPMIEHLWHERRNIGSFDIGTGHWLSAPALAVMQAVRTARDMFRPNSAGRLLSNFSIR